MKAGFITAFTTRLTSSFTVSVSGVVTVGDNLVLLSSFFVETL